MLYIYICIYINIYAELYIIYILCWLSCSHLATFDKRALAYNSSPTDDVFVMMSM